MEGIPSKRAHKAASHTEASTNRGDRHSEKSVAHAVGNVRDKINIGTDINVFSDLGGSTVSVTPNAKAQNFSSDFGFLIHMPEAENCASDRCPSSTTSHNHISKAHPSSDITSMTESVSGNSHSSSDSENESCDESWLGREFTDDEKPEVGLLDDGDILEVCSNESHREEKRRLVSEEILVTEEKYVNELFAITKAFWKIDGANRKSPFLKESEFKQMLPNLDPLYKVHCDHVRPVMLKHMTDKGSSIANAFKEFGPFLKMYRSYVPLMCEASKTLSETRRTCIQLASLLVDIEKDPALGRLSIHCHMSTLFQRILRYRLLLQKYLKYTSCDDLKQTQEAINMIENLIETIEDDMKSKENFAQLFRIQERLEDAYTILDPRRELIREGDVIKLSARTGRKELHRYLFLFNDIMLLCNVQNGRGKYQVKVTLDVEGLKLRDALHLNAFNVSPERTLLLKARQSALTLMFRTNEDRLGWQEAFIKAIGDDVTETQLFMNTMSLETGERPPTNFTRAPTWIPDTSASSCMLCNAKFSAIHRRHHCRGCGIVVDSKCLTNKIRLPFAQHKEKKVCKECFKEARKNYPCLLKCHSSLPDDDYS